MVRAEAWQAAMSRLYGGIHFSSDIVNGFTMGRTIGRMAVAWAERP
jgi:membrane-associated phospholipid phosphatase